MSRVFIIGIPVSIRARLVAAANGHGIDLFLVLAAPGNKGPLQLRPYTAQAAADFEAYLNAMLDWSKARVIILPYTDLPPELDELVAMVEDASGSVLEPVPGEEGWPKAPRGKAPDGTFYDALYAQLAAMLLPAQPSPPCELPSAALRAALGRNELLVVAEGIFDHCDDVAPLRHQFVADTLEAFLHFLINGAGGRIDAFFDSRGLPHAQSGGSLVKVEIWCAGKKLKKFSVQTHIKRGDHTTAEGAARIYYCVFQLKEFKYLGVLYIGAHPEGEMTRWVNLPEGSPGS
jgi:hypothetical protein